MTGATGFVGLNLVAELVEKGWAVTALHRSGSRLDDLRRFPVTLMEGSIRDPGSLERAIPPGVDAIFHVAGNTNTWRLGNREQTADNVEGTRNVVRAARAKEARRLVHTSSIAAFGHHHGTIDETTRSNASQSWVNYCRTKWLAEEEVRHGVAEGLEAVILNPGHIVGPWDRRNWSNLIRAVVRNELPGVPPGRGSWAHVREVARAQISAAERGRVGENYLLGGTDASFLEVIHTIGEITGHRVPRRTTPGFLLKALAHGKDLLSRISRKEPDLTPEIAAMVCATTTCDSTRAKQELGYRSVPLRVMFEDCYRWMTAEGLL
ncbi:MAG TPA: SDR family oxidoreductase [Thermoanaerobaculia bacterium]|nr:SDR family oxidoreductase [Thermoanaerobaculia bacterium]